jgi:F-type H+-transporting ATPase subunit c
MLLANYAAIYINLLGAMSTVMPMLAENVTNGMQYLGAGIAAIGMVGTGVGQGMAAQGACMAVGRNPEVTSKIRTTMIIGSGIAESGAIYALIISILLIFVA